METELRFIIHSYETAVGKSQFDAYIEERVKIGNIMSWVFKNGTLRKCSTWSEAVAWIGKKRRELKKELKNARN